MAEQNQQDQLTVMRALSHTSVHVDKTAYYMVRVRNLESITEGGIRTMSLVVHGEDVTAVIPMSEVCKLPSREVEILTEELNLVSLRAHAGKPPGYLASILAALAKRGLIGRYLSSTNGEHCLFPSGLTEQAVHVLNQLIRSSKQTVQELDLPDLT